MKNKGVIVLLSLLVIVLGFFAYLVSSNKLSTPTDVVYEGDIQKIETISESDNLNDIETDLNNTDLSSIDLELSQIGNELQ